MIGPFNQTEPQISIGGRYLIHLSIEFSLAQIVVEESQKNATIGTINLYSIPLQVPGIQNAG